MGSRTTRRRHPRRQHRPRRPRHFIAPPNEACWIESDSYDRSAFARLCEDSSSLQEVIDTGATLMPRFGAAVEDLFNICFKSNVIFRDVAAVAPSAQPNRPFLAAVASSPAVAALRQQTVLDEVQAGLGALLLADEMLAQIRNQRLWTRDDLRDLWELRAQEDAVRSEIEAYEAATEFADSTEGQKGESTEDRAPDAEEEGEGDGPSAAPALRPGAAARAAKAAAALEHDAEVAEARLRQRARRITERANNTSRDTVRRVEMRALTTAEALGDRPADEEIAWGLGLGSGHRSSPGAQLELGKRLTTNPKLKRLAQMVGRMRQSAFRLRKRTFEQANEETYATSRGGELSRLLPHELVTLRHPALRRDFQRRFVEGQLQIYELRGLEDKGRGPMIVCLDGSSSMAGDKEIWSKAVALTLLDIARRQRRLFRFLCFSSADQPLWTLDLNPRTHYEVNERSVYDLAEYFPGGGTDFETPLNAATDCLRSARYRRGDIVFITDGECRVSPEWLATFRAEKDRLGFFVFSVLIDVGTSAIETVSEFSDRVASVRQLTDDAVHELFLAL